MELSPLNFNFPISVLVESKANDHPQPNHGEVVSPGLHIHLSPIQIVVCCTHSCIINSNLNSLDDDRSHTKEDVNSNEDKGEV